MCSCYGSGADCSGFYGIFCLCISLIYERSDIADNAGIKRRLRPYQLHKLCRFCLHNNIGPLLGYIGPVQAMCQGWYTCICCDISRA